MQTLNRKRHIQQIIPRAPSLEVVMGVIALVAAVTLVWAVYSGQYAMPILVVAGLSLTASVAILTRLVLDPDSIRAHQTHAMLQLSTCMVDVTSKGMTLAAAQEVCESLLPNTQAIAVAITNREIILGYAGYLEADNPAGAAIRTQATHQVIAEGQPRAIYTPEDIGLPTGPSAIKAAIIIPLRVGREIVGTLKFYYRSASKITETQKSIAQGFGTLLSTQIAAAELEEQRELATAMELKMLQSQINPHFLFNTINTIASLIRTNPAQARILLRDFAVFYRSTLENSQDRIRLARELEQTQRYFSFEVARFGEDRLLLAIDLGPEAESVQEMMVPPFLLQPLVENAVKHAMPASGQLRVNILATVQHPDVVLEVADDGVGMDATTRESILQPQPVASAGMGIALKNVRDRMTGFYGEGASMSVQSAPGKGTTITLRFPNEATKFPTLIES